MKYLITVPTLSKGSGLSRYVFTLCKILTPEQQVWVMTTHNKKNTDFEINELKSISPDIKYISIGEKTKIIKYIKAVSVINRIKPDILVNNYDGLIQYILSYISKKIKVIHILHNDTSDFYRVGSINGSRVMGWIAPTQAIKQHFDEYTDFKYQNRVKVIPHGVEECALAKKTNPLLEIVFAGVLYEHKGVKVLPDIIKKLISRGVGLHFTIIGGGILEGWLKKQFEQEIEKNQVEMTGVISHAQVYDYLAKADVFLYPTHLDAFGLVIAEAMMNGAVPVVTHLAGITDNLIESGKEGYLVNEDDVETISNIIVNLWENPKSLTKMSEKTYRKAASAFSQKKMKENYLRHFKFLLS